MKTYSLSATVRKEVGKKATRDQRRQGLIPVEIYGGEKNQSLLVSKKEVRNLIYSPDVHTVELSIEGGDKVMCIVQDLQFHPVTDEVLHIDLLQISEDKPIVVNMPIVLDGFAKGVRAGGTLITRMRYLKVKGLYTNIPDRLHIDITNMGVDQPIQVRNLSFDNLELLNAGNAVVATIKSSREMAAMAAQMEAEEEAAAPAAPEALAEEAAEESAE
ncbi:50S ribosomal protein L25 [uncultured Porphyromonas sp.]|uniref:50S ribosomal protein L25 n=1 Tax=uncultured Porphyromonas sp. TaxID=159274 RepID=UPI002595C965|nr:50S ribosomal protein L25 [uncultured Porphyromonas sp.]